MTTKIPEDFVDLFKKRAFAHLGTSMPDGSIQITPVWVDFDGDYVIINTSRGRQKDRNMQERPQVTVEIQDPDNPYRYLEVRGRVAEAVEEGALDHINKMAKKYTGADKYPFLAPGEVRVIYKIKPQRVLTH